MDGAQFVDRLTAPVIEGLPLEVWHLLAGCWLLVIVVGLVAYRMSRRSRVPRATTKSGLYIRDYGTH